MKDGVGVDAMKGQDRDVGSKGPQWLGSKEVSGQARFYQWPVSSAPAGLCTSWWTLVWNYVHFISLYSEYLHVWCGQLTERDTKMNWTILAVKKLEMSFKSVHKSLKHKVKLVRTTAGGLVGCWECGGGAHTQLWTQEGATRAGLVDEATRLWRRPECDCRHAEQGSGDSGCEGHRKCPEARWHKAALKGQFRKRDVGTRVCEVRLRDLEQVWQVPAISPKALSVELRS